MNAAPAKKAKIGGGWGRGRVAGPGGACPLYGHADCKFGALTTAATPPTDTLKKK